ncbi:MAG: paraquat-inducible protein A [Magnetococcales bacterium]|nr:paraquat-inducible protein A [Magnetococcales bacterium]
MWPRNYRSNWPPIWDGSRGAMRSSPSHTWALVCTAAILYIPANLLPIMTVQRFGQGSPDTIVSGVIRLLEGGLWPLALLVFFASIVVPLLKLIGLAVLLLSVQRRWSCCARQRAGIYRLVEAVGRWSMVDIYMIAILTSMVQFEAIARVEPGPGALFFAAVVVVTLLASHSFDPRWLWRTEEWG